MAAVEGHSVYILKEGPLRFAGESSVGHQRGISPDTRTRPFSLNLGEE